MPSGHSYSPTSHATAVPLGLGGRESPAPAPTASSPGAHVAQGHTGTRAGPCWGPPKCLQRTAVTTLQETWGGAQQQRGDKPPGRTLHGTWPDVWARPVLAETTAQWGKGWASGQRPRRGKSESASRAQCMPQGPMMSASTQAVWTGAFNCGLWSQLSGVGVRTINKSQGWRENPWSGCLAAVWVCVHEQSFSLDRALTAMAMAMAMGLDRRLTRAWPQGRGTSLKL